MKHVIAVSAAFLIACSAFANDLPDTTTKALAAGEPAAVIKALDKEIYRGNIVAAQALGFIYRDGKLVAQDYAKARKWLKVAAQPDRIRIWYKRGLADAQLALGLLLRDGLGGKPDASAAASWFELAAEQGEAQAQLALAQLQLKGVSIKPNPERAYIWSSLAARTLTEAAQKDAEQVREAARHKLAPPQVKSADEFVENWAPKRS